MAEFRTEEGDLPLTRFSEAVALNAPAFGGCEPGGAKKPPLTSLIDCLCRR
jgi:hypothetical protein